MSSFTPTAITIITSLISSIILGMTLSLFVLPILIIFPGSSWQGRNPCPTLYPFLRCIFSTWGPLELIVPTINSLLSNIFLFTVIPIVNSNYCPAYIYSLSHMLPLELGLAWLLNKRKEGRGTPLIVKGLKGPSFTGYLCFIFNNFHNNYLCCVIVSIRWPVNSSVG